MGSESQTFYSKVVLDLKNSIDKLMKGKETLNSILDSQKLHGNVHGIGYGNRISSSSSLHINFIKASSHSTPSSSK